MTKDEALVQLRIGPGINEDVSEEYDEAVDMAIEALEQQPSEDCVSREAVLSIIKSICFSEEYAQFRADYGSNGQRDAAIIYIKALPSVAPQPSKRTEERTEMHECDCISRQFMYDMGATCIAARNKDGDLVALGALDILPSATPQPKTGRWILSGGYWRCSECKEKALLKLDKATGGYREYEPVRSKYCPECGCRMQEVKK